ncbi:carbon-nitrogen hydrolase family protein [Rhodohalobacter mucosus]|uniref:Hydrolase n=1 Tax=Rhodohalobacter mucosus TaxID=2079485 RepID=A0A316TTQ2_9BACT|nr:carbon-nitrogen hydrolase family protein [Rhodohalobacter mucosus]PWN07963.1 hydrolase [Rhodohalobacter mucosus]
MDKVKIAAVQLNSQPDTDQSLEQAYGWVKQAADSGAVFISLPENFAFLGDEKQKLEQAAEISGKVEKALPDWSREFGATILGGGYPVPAGKGKVFNRAVVVDPNGDFVASYDKIHLFDVDLSDEETWRESETVEAGKAEAVVYKPDNEQMPATGLTICYDIRFPELYRRLVIQGADLIAVPSAFTRPTGEAHWEVLLRARAIENSCYVMAPAQCGLHGTHRKTWGHSMIIDPWGEVLAVLDSNDKPGFVTAEFDRGALDEVRKRLPSLRHRVL